MSKFYSFILSLIVIICLSACDTMPQVQAERRLFPPVSLEFMGEETLTRETFQETPIGGLSAITYDLQKNCFYALSDDRSQQAPARFYTLKINISPTDDKPAQIEGVIVENVTFLKDKLGQTYRRQTIDPEGISLSPKGTIFISSEGSPKRGIKPFIGEFDRVTGQLQQEVTLPQRYLLATEPEASPRGVEENLGFEPLTISATSTLKDDPFRLFTAIEGSLKQDTSPTPPRQIPLRLLHYVISTIGPPVIVAEHLYLLDETPKGAIANGLTELLALPQEGSWLSLERTFGINGFGAKLFQVVNSSASETSSIVSFQDGVEGIKPLSKKLLWDLQDLDIKLDNLEGMTLGPRLADGSQTLILISDDNFNSEQKTQLLLFQLKT